MGLKNLKGLTKINIQALKKISIFIMLACFLSACSQIGIIFVSKEVRLSPLSGEMVPTGLHMDMLGAINAVRVQGITCDGVFQDSIASVSWNPKLAGAAKTQVKDILNRANNEKVASITQVVSHGRFYWWAG